MAPHYSPLNKKIDKALETRNACLFGLGVSWVAGIAAVGGGCYCVFLSLYGNGAHFILPHLAKEVLPLGINIIVTFLNESMGYIHTTSLRWSLQFENRLTFNSNLRLLSSSHRSKPNAWYSNFLFIFYIILSYATTSLIFLGWNSDLTKTLGTDDDTESQADPNTIHVSGVALIFFGVALLGQAFIATWSYRATQIPTWSSNPLDTVYACIDVMSVNQIVRRKDRCMKSVHQIEEDSYPCAPKRKQGPAYTAHKEVKWVLFLLWSLVPLGAVWGAAIYTMIVRGNPRGVLGNSWSFIPQFTGTSSSCSAGRAAKCTDGSSVLNVGWTGAPVDGDISSSMKGNIGSIFLIGAFQGGLTLALHCAELLVNLSRDEGIFRMAITEKGTDSRYNSIVAAFTSWQTIILFLFKAAVHWLFGLSINNDFMLGVNMYPSQIFYFTAFTLAVAVFATYVSLRGPAGPLPATFGHLQTMADLIDDPHRCMFWGHKEDGDPNYAGTSATWLPMPKEGQLYGGVEGLSRDVLAQGISIENLAAAWDMDHNGGMYNSHR